jgi:hypothetical protein
MYWVLFALSVAAGGDWRDEKTGLHWATPSAVGNLSHATALALCEPVTASETDFGVATAEELRAADENGLRSGLPEVRGDRYWTADEEGEGRALVFDGRDASFRAANRTRQAARALCVGTPVSAELARVKFGLRPRFRALAEAMRDALEPRFSETIAWVRAVQETPDYRKCTRPRRLSSKEEQVRACVRVSEDFKRAPGSKDSARASAAVGERDEELLGWVHDAKPSESHLNLALETRQGLLASYVREMKRVQEFVRQFNAGHQLACGALELGKSVECAVGRALRLLELELPELLRDSQALLGRDARALLVTVRRAR